MTPAHDLLPTARQAIKIAQEVMDSRPVGRSTLKSDRDVATDVDYEIEDRVRSFLDSETPEIGFLGEERGGSAGTRDEWVLDPLDGTSNFVHDLPMYGSSLALLQNGEPVLGLIVLPRMDLYYLAELGRGAQCNSELLRVSSTDVLDHAIVSLGDYAVGPGAEERNRDRISVTAALAARVERVRMTGSAAMDLAWVAHGKLDAAVILSNKPWDTAAGTLIAREAGATVVDRFGARHSMHSSTTIAVTPDLQRELLPLLAYPEH